MYVYVGAPGPPHSFCAVFQVREKMKRYWESNSKYASVEEMMLDSNAAQLTSHDKTDILGMVPKLEVRKKRGGVWKLVVVVSTICSFLNTLCIYNGCLVHATAVWCVHTHAFVHLVVI